MAEVVPTEIKCEKRNDDDVWGTLRSNVYAACIAAFVASGWDRNPCPVLLGSGEIGIPFFNIFHGSTTFIPLMKTNDYVVDELFSYFIFFISH